MKTKITTRLFKPGHAEWRYSEDVRKLAIAFACALLPSVQIVAQDLGPKDEPEAMSSHYSPLMWRGDVADFAVYTERTTYCQAGFSKMMADRLVDNNLLSAARLSASEHEHIYRKIKLMARALDFEFPPKGVMQDCPEWRQAEKLEGPDLTKAWVSYLSKTNGLSVQQLHSLVAKPEKPDNSGIRKLAEQVLPSLENLQAKLDAGEDPRSKTR